MSTKKPIQLEEIVRILSEIKRNTRHIILTEYEKSPNYNSTFYGFFINSSLLLESFIEKLLTNDFDPTFMGKGFNAMAILLGSYIGDEENIDDNIEIAERVSEMFGDIAKCTWSEEAQDLIVTVEPYENIDDFIKFSKDCVIITKGKLNENEK